MVNITITSQGNLKLAIEPLARDELRETIDLSTHKNHGVLAELLEAFQANGIYYPIEPGDGTPGGGAFIGLTDAPCIATDVDFEDDGSTTINGDVWWYPDYMIRSFAEVLHRNLSVEFTKS
jgi:hypothetical protein